MSTVKAEVPLKRLLMTVAYLIQYARSQGDLLGRAMLVVLVSEDCCSSPAFTGTWAVAPSLLSNERGKYPG